MIPTPTFRSLALPLATEPAGTRRVLILAFTVTGLAGGLCVLFPLHAIGEGYAASGSPPPPPTYMPTPIGPPPAHPAFTSAATAVITPSATASTSPTSVPTKAAEAVRFSLDAARVAPVQDPGDLSGLVAVRPKSNVWLMMYLTIKSMPRKSSSLSTYVIQRASQVIMRAAFGWSAAADVTGRFSRFMPYTIPSQLSYGDRLTLKTTLKIGVRSQTRSWNFVIARQQKFATTSHFRHSQPSGAR